MEKFLALYDIHWGYERKGGHLVPLHDLKAVNVAMKFAKDFKPDHIILGGDILDCGAISHHNRNKPGNVEGLRLVSDAKGVRDTVIKPLEALGCKTLTFITGNHEDWLNDLIAEHPGLADVVSPRAILKLGEEWRVVDVGGYHKLGKLVFIHGDQIKSSVSPAKLAVEAFEANVRLGHHHTFQVHTKTSAVDSNGHTGMCVPCLARKDPNYGGGAPNKWMQGFLYGYVNGPHGSFNDYPVVIVNGIATINGKTYCG